MIVLLDATFKRVQPSATYGMGLTVHNPVGEKMLNRVRAWWLRRVLELQSPVPRILIMEDLGVRLRLSAVAWARAIMLRERMRCIPTYAAEERVLQIARRDVNGWTAAIEDQISHFNMTRLAPPANSQSKEAVPYHCRRFREQTVTPRVRCWEAQRWSDTRVKQVMSRCHESCKK